MSGRAVARTGCIGAAGWIAALGLTAACSLADVVTPDADELLVVEAVLRADVDLQYVLLHSSVSDLRRLDSGAVVEVFPESGATVRFSQSAPPVCLQERFPAGHTCYTSDPGHGTWVRPGETYELRVTARDGGQAGGRTRVPGEFRILHPELSPERICGLPPATPLPLVWSRSEATWAYVSDLEISGLSEALAGRVPGDIPDPMNLTGLAITAADTTMVMPGDFGIFQRTQFDQELLIALRDGLPDGVVARVVIAAADRNYVNGVRGGNFNPSGRVRIPSVTGDATGLFGSLLAHAFVVDVRTNSPYPPCLGPDG